MVRTEDIGIMEMNYEVNKRVRTFWICQDTTGRYYLNIYNNRYEIFYTEIGKYIHNALEYNDITLEDLVDRTDMILKACNLRLSIIGYGNNKEECVNNILKFMREMLAAYRNKSNKHSKHRCQGKLCKNCVYAQKVQIGGHLVGYWCDMHEARTNAWLSCDKHMCNKSWTLPSRWNRQVDMEEL